MKVYFIFQEIWKFSGISSRVERLPWHNRIGNKTKKQIIKNNFKKNILKSFNTANEVNKTDEYDYNRIELHNENLAFQNKEELYNKSKYYSKLSPEIIIKVYKRFKLDFELFDYNVLDVLKLGNHCQNLCEEFHHLLSREE